MIPNGYIVRFRAGTVPSDYRPDRDETGVTRAFDLISREGATAEALAELVESADGVEAVPRLFYWIERLSRLGLLEFTLTLFDGSSLVASPHRAGFHLRTLPLAESCSYVLSRFAFLRRSDNRMVLESPAVPGIIIFQSWLPAAVASMFSEPRRPSELAGKFFGPAASDAIPIANMLFRAGFLAAVEESVSPAAALWGFHEFLFHDRSSSARIGELFGGVEERVRPAASVPKQPVSDERVPLVTPDLERLMREDPPFTAVVENRRSFAEPGPVPLSVSELGEFLFRTVHPQSRERRPIASAGARNELEYYVAVRECRGLSRGLYHYDVSTHHLRCLNGAQDSVLQSMLDQARRSWATGRHYPNVLIIIASRFTRMASRYASIAYRNTLLDAGLALHAMYLIATAMQLAPCALGLNFPTLFAQATGLDSFEETSVALMVLNSRPRR